MMIKRKNNKNGFTLVELIIGIVISAVIALTAGIMLVGIFLAWQRAESYAELQRDGAFALDIMSREIRPAGDVTVPDPSQIIIGTEAFYWKDNPDPNVQDDLWYDPTAALPNSGDEVPLINGKVVSITFIKNPTDRYVSIIMRLEDEYNQSFELKHNDNFGNELPIIIGYRN